MYILAQIVGVLAVTLFLTSYQFKKRKHIILVNAISNTLYVLQYIMLGAFEGAMIDFLSAVQSIVAHNRDKKYILRFLKPIIIILNISILVAGLILYKNIFSLCAIIGAILQTGAFWITKEKYIRLISFISNPFWLIYNLTNHAYGSAFGSVLAIVSVAIAIVRYDIINKSK